MQRWILGKTGVQVSSVALGGVEVPEGAVAEITATGKHLRRK